MTIRTQPTQFMGVRISRPGKVLWPDVGGRPIRKLDLARYFAAVAEPLLEQIAGRPCSLVRAPEGIGGTRFFQRHPMRGTPPQIEAVRVPGERRAFIRIERVEALVALAQIGALELHPWNSAPGDTERPGRLVFDLDPAPDVGFAAVTEAARELRARLEATGLAAFCKTTGGKGLHVVVPLAHDVKRGADWRSARAFAQQLCTGMAADSPGRYLVSMARRARHGRIFLDFLRNDRMATAVAPLSPRARDGAPVSMPLDWSQVRSGLDPGRFTVRTAPALLGRRTPWQHYGEAARPLAPALQRLEAAHPPLIPPVPENPRPPSGRPAASRR